MTTKEISYSMRLNMIADAKALRMLADAMEKSADGDAVSAQTVLDYSFSGAAGVYLTRSVKDYLEGLVS